SLWENRTLGLVSRPGEKEADFRKRCDAAARQEAEQALALEKAKFKPKFDSLDLKLPAEQPAKGAESWLGRVLKETQALETDDPKQTEKRRKLMTDYLSKFAEIEAKWKHI